MRRGIVTVFALAFPLVLSSVVAGAAPPKGAAPAASGSASAAASVAAATPSSAPSASAPASAASAPAPGAAPTAAAAGSDASMNGATYAVRLRDLEQRVDELKDQIRRSHTRLALLSDTIMGGGSALSRGEIVFKNEMSSAFQLVSAVFVMDSKVQYNRQDDTGALGEQKEIPIYSGSLPPGDHIIQIALTFQGSGFGVFSYLKGYKFEVKSSHAVTAVEGKTDNVIITAYEKGGVTTPLEQRPAVEWEEKFQNVGAPSAASPAAAPGSAKGSAGISVSGGLSVGGGTK